MDSTPRYTPQGLKFATVPGSPSKRLLPRVHSSAVWAICLTHKPCEFAHDLGTPLYTLNGAKSSRRTPQQNHNINTSPPRRHAAAAGQCLTLTAIKLILLALTCPCASLLHAQIPAHDLPPLPLLSTAPATWFVHFGFPL